jgi:hypothetical protein
MENPNWKADVAFGGSKFICQIYVTSFGSIGVKYIDKNLKKENEIKHFFPTNTKYFQKLFNLSILKKDCFYDFNNRSTLETLKKTKFTKTLLENLQIVSNEYNIDLSVDYVSTILKMNSKNNKLKMIFCNTVFHDIIGADEPDNDLKGVEILSNGMTFYNYTIFCAKNSPKSTFDLLNFFIEEPMRCFDNGKPNSLQVVKIGNSSKSNFTFESSEIDYNERKSSILEVLSEISGENMQELYFDSNLFQVFLQFPLLNNMINEYYSNLNNCQSFYKSLVSYLQVLAKNEIMNICTNNEQYNLFLRLSSGSVSSS